MKETSCKLDHLYFFQTEVISCLLQLSLNCLTFDFVGSMIDETGDDSVTVQVPTVWRIGNQFIYTFYSF